MKKKKHRHRRNTRMLGGPRPAGVGVLIWTLLFSKPIGIPSDKRRLAVLRCAHTMKNIFSKKPSPKGSSLLPLFFSELFLIIACFVNFHVLVIVQLKFLLINNALDLLPFFLMFHCFDAEVLRESKREMANATRGNVIVFFSS